jgi:outer membrane receptor protein involved in Fe transport
VFYQDIEVSRRLGHLKIMAGIYNLTNITPPTLVDGETNTDTNTYDVVGRYFWARMSYDF